MTTELDLDFGEGRVLHAYDTGPADAALAVFWHHGTPNLGAPPKPLFARPQVPGALRDLLIEADPRPGRAFALVRRIVEDPQRRLHPPDRHQAVARLHNNSLLAGRGHGPRGCPDRSICTRPCRGGGLAETGQIGSSRASRTS